MRPGPTSTSSDARGARTPRPLSRRPAGSGRRRAGVALLLAGLLLGCTDDGAPRRGDAAADPGVQTPPLELASERWAGDLDGMRERRVVRALVVPSQINYFVADGRPQGIAHDLLAAFERQLNRRYPPERNRPGIRVVVIPTSRDDLLPALLEGRGDIAVAGLTGTPGRPARADVSAPFVHDVAALLVTGPATPAPAALDDLAGREVGVRPWSSAHDQLQALSRRLVLAGRAPLRLRLLPEALHDADLMELVATGRLAATVVDDLSARYWTRVHPELVVHPGIALERGGESGWMLRRHNPLLKAEIDRFARGHRQGTLFGNTVIRRYSAPRAAAAGASFAAIDALFRRYAERYDLDHLLLRAQGYQESRLDHGAVSRAGAVGIMQVMPQTGAALGVGDIHQLEANIHGASKYLRDLLDRYFPAAELDQLNRTLFAVAAYNAGPTRIARLRRQAAERGLDPNRWFGQVELLAAAEIGRETVDYVHNVFEYYATYRLLAASETARDQARAEFNGQT